MHELLRTVPDLDAVFVASDLMAVAALRVLREAGRAAPDDVAVVGYDDIPLALHTDPPLTTLHQPAERMGSGDGAAARRPDLRKPQRPLRGQRSGDGHAHARHPPGYAGHRLSHADTPRGAKTSAARLSSLSLASPRGRESGSRPQNVTECVGSVRSSSQNAGV